MQKFSLFSLRNLLLIDALTCAAMGSVLALGAFGISPLTDLSEFFLTCVGALLLPLALLMAAFAMIPQIRRLGAMVVVAGNIAWVAASIILPLTGLISPNGVGLAVILVQALAVVVLIILEARALRRSAAPVAA